MAAGRLPGVPASDPLVYCGCGASLGTEIKRSGCRAAAQHSPHVVVEVRSPPGKAAASQNSSAKGKFSIENQVRS